MRELARQEGMTCFNLFVKVNQHAFSLVDGAFTVDYSALRLSMGDVMPVENALVVRRDGRVLEVAFDKGHGFSHDHVHMFVYAPGLERGLMSLPVFRRDKKVSIMLPDRFADEELHVYLMVHTDDGRWSDSVYVGSGQWSVNGELRELDGNTLINGELRELRELDGNGLNAGELRKLNELGGKGLRNGELLELRELDGNSHNSPLKEAPPE